MTTLRDILLTTPLPQLHTSFEKAPGAASPSLSQKSRAKDYHDVKVEAIKNPTPAHMSDLLGPEDELDHHFLGLPMHPLNPTYQLIQTEGDVARVGNLIFGPMLPFHDNGPVIIQRSESGPLGTTHVRQTVDFTFAWGDRCLATGEFKRPWIIDPAMWTTRRAAPANTNRARLGKELKG